ncbi:hypothetical protein L596_027754 [Steinernema carpocapsae]|uniref:Uncharacterized protein n=1 Tax=Steinernema carpocapsae TaxID=34508 RepID=A0A4U5LWD9_STECR|nr:hypothetical protein L596_027754 [Steinernema carpocapsae]
MRSVWRFMLMMWLSVAVTKTKAIMPLTFISEPPEISSSCGDLISVFDVGLNRTCLRHTIWLVKNLLMS